MSSRYRESLPDQPGECDQAQIERALLEIFEQSFQERVERDCPISDIISNNRSLYEVVDKIEQRIGISIPLTVFLEVPTIAALAEKMCEPNWQPSWNMLVQFDKIDSTHHPNHLPDDPPINFFCLHTVDGHGYWYLPLARHLQPHCRLYALQSPFLETQKPFGTLAEHLQRYISCIQEVQPHGPYFLGGWSAGGALAFSVAQSLRHQGETVSCVAMFDTTFIREQEREASLSKLRRDCFYLEEYYWAPPLRSFYHQLIYNSQPESYDSPLVVFESAGMAKFQKRLAKRMRRSILRLQFRKFWYTSKWLKAKKSTRCKHWARVAVHFREIQASGSHVSMINEPDVARLAKRLLAELSGKAR